MKIKSFSTVYGLFFSTIGLIVGIWIAYTTTNKDYSYFYVYSGIAGFITAKLIAMFLIEKKKKYTHSGYLITAAATGLFSHWLCWYIITLELNFRYWILGDYFFSQPLDPLLGIVGVFVFCIWSWMFFGWATIAGGMISVYATKWIYEKNTSALHDNA